MANTSLLDSQVNRAFVFFATLLAALTIIGAWGFEAIGGYVPCELCLGQRIPYYLGVPLLGLLFAFWHRLPGFLRLMLTLLSLVVFIWSVYLGVSHAGVEWKFWPGPTSCTGTGAGVSFSDLNALNDVQIVPCDQPEFRFLWLSFAGYNALISLAISWLILKSCLGQVKRK